MTHFFRIAAVIAAIILCMVLPFLPGRYDGLAVPLSQMAQLFGKVGLLLVPLGALWLVSDRGRRIALIGWSAVGCIVSLGAFVESLALGFGILAIGAFLIVNAFRRSAASRSTMPLYFIVVPIAVALIQFLFSGPMVEFSRDRAIRNSAPLIRDIERYRVANGHYPRSVVSVTRDYLPSVIGIKEYRYEPSGDSYNVLFEQITFALGTIEVVMYNPRDQQAIASHAMDVLQLTPEQLALDQTRGHYAVHTTRHPHWKYFWFD